MSDRQKKPDEIKKPEKKADDFQKAQNTDSMRLKKNAMRFIILMGLVSLFADMTYEGARSVTGPFLEILGASALVVGFAAGFGEFVGYALRLISGYVADKTQRYWAITIGGYALNLLAVPLLALVGHWQIAILLIILERMGKAIRTPARDTILSNATAHVGRGWGFGVHEAMDQIGAISGPLIVAAVLYLQGGNSYNEAFAVLAIPAILALATLAFARRRYPNPVDMERGAPEKKAPHPMEKSEKKLSRTFWLYTLFTLFAIAGYATFPLISYHFTAKSIVPEVQIPIFFAFAMGIDALVALLVGRAYDKRGLLMLLTVPLLTIPIPLLTFSSSYGMALLGVALWGAAMGVQETIMRAAIADMVPLKIRGTAYGIFNTAYGGAWFVGSVVMGALYEVSIPLIAGFVIALELIALILLILTRSEFSKKLKN